jgi:hypothetical protein
MCSAKSSIQFKFDFDFDLDLKVNAIRQKYKQ